MAAMSTAAPAGLVGIRRVPIVGTDLKVWAYALSRRDAAGTGDASSLLPALARAGLSTLAGAHPALLEVDAALLATTDGPSFGPDAVVLAVDGTRPLGPDGVQRLRELADDGYTIVVDAAGAPGRPPLSLAGIVRVPAAGIRAGGRPSAAAAHARLLAVGVQDEADFVRCRDAGCELFAGDFICRPLLVTGRPIPADGLSALRAAATLSRSDVTFEQVEEMVLGDPGLSLQLLRLVNSAAYGLPRRIGSAHQAITMIGARAVRQWAIMLALAGTAPASDAIVPIALTRTRSFSRRPPPAATSPTRASRWACSRSPTRSPAHRWTRAPSRACRCRTPWSPRCWRAPAPDGSALSAVIALDVAGEPACGDTPAGLAAAYADGLVWAQQRTAIELPDA